MVEAHREQLEEEKEQARKQDREFAANIQRLTEAYNEQPKKTASAYKPKGRRILRDDSIHEWELFL